MPFAAEYRFSGRWVSRGVPKHLREGNQGQGAFADDFTLCSMDPLLALFTDVCDTQIKFLSKDDAQLTDSDNADQFTDKVKSRDIVNSDLE